MGTFQAILYEGTNKVQLQYRDLLGGSASQGNSATIGINKDGTTASQAYFNTASLSEGQAISFTPDGGGGYTVNTAATYDLVYLTDANAPDAPILSAPTNSATGLSTTPTFSWGAANLADTYQLIIASDAGYSNIIINESGLTGTSYTPSTPLDTNTMYYWKVIAINGSGTAISDGWKFTTLPPDDNDGVSQTVEAAAPNGGDANGDSIPDDQQANVTSLVNPVTNTYTVLDNSGCTSNANVSAASHANSNIYSFPAGMLNFTLTCANPGDTATVTLYYYGVNANDLVLQKYNTNTQEYQSIPGATITQVTIGGQEATKVVYDITDGSSLDQDGIADGTIVDPVGLASLLATTPGVPNTGVGRYTNSLADILIALSMSCFTIAGIVTIQKMRKS